MSEAVEIPGYADAVKARDRVAERVETIKGRLASASRGVTQAEHHRLDLNSKAAAGEAVSAADLADATAAIAAARESVTLYTDALPKAQAEVKEAETAIQRTLHAAMNERGGDAGRRAADAKARADAAALEWRWWQRQAEGWNSAVSSAVLDRADVPEAQVDRLRAPAPSYTPSARPAEVLIRFGE